MKISVIVPVYNVEKYLSVCIESVINQSFTDWEMLLVDDGSTDGGGMLCDRYAAADERIHAIHQLNGGLSAARNTGLSHASGKYVLFLDSDDYIVSHALQTLYDMAEENAAQEVLFEPFLVDETGCAFFEPTLSSYYTRHMPYPGVYRGPELFAAMKKNGDYFPCAWSALYLRESIAVSFAPILHEDELFTVQQLYSLDRVCCCGEKLYAHRVRPGSIMQSRVTAANFRGRVAAVVELSKLKNADDALRQHLYSLSYTAAACYARLDRREKTAARADRHALTACLKQQQQPWTRRALTARASAGSSPSMTFSGCIFQNPMLSAGSSAPSFCGKERTFAWTPCGNLRMQNALFSSVRHCMETLETTLLRKENTPF